MQVQMHAGRKEDKYTTETANDEPSFSKWSADTDLRHGVLK